MFKNGRNSFLVGIPSGTQPARCRRKPLLHQFGVDRRQQRKRHGVTKQTHFSCQPLHKCVSENVCLKRVLSSSKHKNKSFSKCRTSVSVKFLIQLAQIIAQSTRQQAPKGLTPTRPHTVSRL